MLGSCLHACLGIFEVDCDTLSGEVSGEASGRCHCVRSVATICVQHLRAKIKLRHCVNGTTRTPTDTNIHHASARIATWGPSCQD